MDVHGKVVVVTGASAGIGRATARLFAEHGAKVALLARSADKLTQLAEALPNALSVPVDMRDEQAMQRAMTAVYEHYGRIDVLINNAGQGMHVPIAQANVADYRALLELNLVSVLVAMQAVIPQMRQQGGGSIINISSGLSKRILPSVGPYASTKYALNALTLTARLELAPDHIHVGLVYPGITETDFMQNAIRVANSGGPRQGAVVDTPEHVAEMILEAVRLDAAETYADSIRPSSAA